MEQDPIVVLRSVGKSGLTKLQEYLEYRLQRQSNSLEGADGNDVYRSQGSVKELRRLLLEINSLL